MKFVVAFFKKYPHIVWAVWIPLYVAGFFAAQAIITPESAHIVAYLPVDDTIPFVPFFVVFYYLWFPFMGTVGFYFLFTDAIALKRYMLCLGWGFCVVLLLYFLIPSGQELYPESYPEGDVFARVVRWLHGYDSTVNVFPSGHVMGALVTLFAVCNSQKLCKWYFALPSALLTLCICLSTVLIKQHSLLDVIAGALLCLGLYFAVYGRSEELPKETLAGA